MEGYGKWVRVGKTDERMCEYAAARRAYVQAHTAENLRDAVLYSVYWKNEVAPVLTFFFVQPDLNRGFIVEDSLTTKPPKLILPFRPLERAS